MQLKNLLKNPQLLCESNFINGEFFTKDKKITVQNPATLEVIGHVPHGDKIEAKVAIEAAQKAMIGWKKLAGKERAKMS